jgi:hypothetical protein
VRAPSITDEANAFCFAVEEQSFWFNYRNRFIVEAVKQFRRQADRDTVATDRGAGSTRVESCDGTGSAGVANAKTRGQSVVCATLSDADSSGDLDAVGLFDVEHIADDRSSRAWRRAAEPGGWLYVTVPARRSGRANELSATIAAQHHRPTASRGFAVATQRISSRLALPLFRHALLASAGAPPDPARTVAGSSLRPASPPAQSAPFWIARS